MRIAFAILACAFLASSGPAFAAAERTKTASTAPSFDCARSQAPVETLTCASPQLSALDRDMADAFRASRESLGQADRTQSLQVQRQWLRSRLQLCAVPAGGTMDTDKTVPATACLVKLYGERIAALKGEAAKTPVAKPATGVAAFDKTLFPATGPQEALLTVPDFGRYALQVKSDSGTAIQLVDRMAGPGNAEGSAGHADGRVDAFLDHGQYKVRLTADPHGSGDAELSVTPSAELETTPRQLVELKPLDGDLGDHQQRSYWLDIASPRDVAIEASGRYLDDLRLWRDGKWLVDATPGALAVDPASGQPLAVRQLAAHLEPGLYRVTAYGGQGQKWANGSDAKPLHIRYGIPTLAEAGRTYRVASPTGTDRFLVPASATYFRLDIDRPDKAAISVQPYDAKAPFNGGSNRATIDKKSRDPFAELAADAGTAGTFDLVTVEREPGAAYRLTWFDDREERTPLNVHAGESGFISMFNSGNDVDQLDPTVVVTDPKDRVLASTAIKAGKAIAWRRRFNLLGTTGLFIEATEAVDLTVAGTGEGTAADAEYQIDPLIAHEGYSPVPYESSGYVWKLDPGFYRLTIRPRQNGKGILALTLRGTGVSLPTTDAPRQAAGMLRLDFPMGGNYWIYGNVQADVNSGMRVYNSPINLAQGAAFEMAGGQGLTLPVTTGKDGRVTAVAEDGTALAVKVDDAGGDLNAPIAKGRHDITLTLPAGDPRYVAVSFTPRDLAGDAPLPVIDAKTMAGLPDFPGLAEGKPDYVDLGKGRHASFAVPVTKAALYRLESTGIIETAGTLRTRVIPQLDQESANGIGRNFLIQRYLGQGDYQLTVTPPGASAGTIGVTLSEAPLIDEGTLTPDLVARTTLKPSEAGLYKFRIDREGTYSLKTLGLGHEWLMRLEDADGWPLLPPGGTADITYDFLPGDYRMVLLPGAVENRAVTTLHRIEKPAERAGHGPFAVSFGKAMTNRWLEPAKGEARAPDVWTFTLPAAANVTIGVDAGMKATLSGNDGESDAALAPRSANDFKGLLPAGKYMVEIVSAVPNNRVDYTLTVDTKELVAGERRTVQAPMEIPVAIGGGAPVEINSYGDADIRATLYDGAGQIVAANDDRDNDWNFSIASSLAAGNYKLRVEPVGSDAASTEVAIEQPAETTDAPAVLDRQATIADALVHVVPIDAAALKPNSLVIVEAQSASPVGIAIGTNAAQSGMNPFFGLPIGDKPAPLSLRIWSRDHTATPITYAITDVEPKTVDEATILKGASLAPVASLGNRISALRATGLKRGVLFVEGEHPTLQSAGPGEETQHDATGQLPSHGADLDISFIERTAADQPVLKLRNPDPKSGRLTLTVPAGENILVRSSAAPTGTAVLWKVTSRGAGQAGVATEWDPRQLAFGGPETGRVGITVAMQAGDGVNIWQPEDASRTTDLPVTLTRQDFELPAARALTAEVTDGTFAGSDAARFSLADGEKTLSLNLPEGTAAVLTQSGKTVSTIWAWRPRVFVVPTSADTLTLLYTGKKQGAYSIALDRSGGGGTAAQRYDYSGTLVLQSPRSMTAYGLGAVEDMTVTNGFGLKRGANVTLIGNGSTDMVAFVDFRPGLTAYRDDLPPILDSTVQATALDASAPQSLPLAPVRIAAGPARLVRVRADVPSIFYAGVQGDGKIAPKLLEAGTDYFLLLPDGQSRDLMAYPADPTAKGTMSLSVLTTTPIAEGLGPKRRIAPGEARAFSFSLPEARTVGVGVRASVDVANCYAVGPDGVQQGGPPQTDGGKLVMAKLPAGTSTLVVTVPANAEPVEIEPALVGSVLPGDGPPDEVKAQYLSVVNGATIKRKNKQ